MQGTFITVQEIFIMMINFNTMCHLVYFRGNATTQSQTHYQTLGVQNEASSKEIRSAYLELCKKVQITCTVFSAKQEDISFYMQIKC